MLGWNRRCLFLVDPFFLPRDIRAEGRAPGKGLRRLWPFLFFLLLTFALTAGARLLELPYWDNPAYRLGDEYLLATHDAYHWIAGAEGFEFGAGHPMSELARLLAQITGLSPAQIGFWLPPFMGGVLAVGVFLWGWGLGYPYAGVCAGVLASLAPAFCARTLLGFYDTDLVVLLFALLLGLVPALWLTPWLSSLPELLYVAIRKRFGKTICRMADTAEIPDTAENADTTESAAAPLPPVPLRIPSESPLQEPLHTPPETPPRARCFSRWFFGRAALLPGEFSMSFMEMQRSMLAWPWMGMLILSGLFGHWMRDWHSLFPYLVYFSALALPLLILFLGPAGGRTLLLCGALCHVLPLLHGPQGVLAALAWYGLLALSRHPSDPESEDTGIPCHPAFARFRHCLPRSKTFLFLVWAAVLFLAFDSSVYEAMMRSFAAYVDRSGDMSPASAVVDDPLIFPSVAQSIIEVQTITLDELLVYIYPLEIITIICFILFACRLAVTPAFVWLLPLLALSVLSLRMGARMIMFSPPVLMLALCMEGGLLLEFLFFRLLVPRIFRNRQQAAPSAPFLYRSPAKTFLSWGAAARLFACLVCTVSLAWPLVALLPDYTQGPIISPEHAEGLVFIKENTEEDGFVWNWWDWGYATHHFARRHTIADGARHGGPSLFLPAAVYTTADPRFARQVIKYTANKGNVPGNVFAGLSAAQAQQLMRDLGDKRKPLIEAPGRQYLVVSFELLRLGLWVTRYGSWNFETKQAPGSLMNNLSQAIEFNVETGAIQPEKSQPVYAGSIDIFEHGELERLSYNRYGAYHFIFNTQSVNTNRPANMTPGLLERFWTAQRGHFTFAASGNDKMVVDDVFYNTMMVQLLLCSRDDPTIAPYFRLVFDNTYTRVYEVR